MRTRISTFLFVTLLSVAAAPELYAQGTVFSDQGRLIDSTATANGAAQSKPLTGDKAIEHLKSTGQYESLNAAITGARYAVKTNSTGESAATAANPAHRLRCTFDPMGLRLEVRTGDAAKEPVQSVSWRLESIGYGTAQLPVPAGALKTKGARVEIARGAPRLTEWFQNTPAGLEHGFTIAERPAANPHGEPLRLLLAVTGDLAPQANTTGQNLSLCAATGRTVITYDRLKVCDAAGAELPAKIEAGAGYVMFVVNELTASYPLTIDPVFAQQAYLKASNTGGNDLFGASVAVSGNTVVVGAFSEDSNATGVNGDGGNNLADQSGAVYVFVRTGNTWTQQAYLKASNTETFDNFGVSVAVSGDTIVVGAGGDSGAEDSNATGVNGDQSNNSATDSGAAYVFVRSGTTWSQQAYLKASNTDINDRFGWSVAISGDTVVVGAPFEDSNATGVNGNGGNNTAADSGAAYVFVRSGTNWSQQAYLKASNTEAGDQFGSSVAVSVNSVVVGAPQEDSSATGVDGDGSNNSAQDAGAAYVFLRSGTTWTQQAYLKAGNLTAQFGFSVAVAGDTIVIGAPADSSNATGVNGDINGVALFSGAAYVFFFRNGPVTFGWIQRAYLKASNTEARDSFGQSVAVSGGTVVVGAPEEDSNATGINGDGGNNNATSAGAAYVFVRGGTFQNPTWSFQDYFKASNTDADDRFGWSVAVSTDTIVIGAPFEDSNATGINGNQNNHSAATSGAAYIFGAPLPPAPEIAVEQPFGTNIPDGGTDQDFVAAVSNTTSQLFLVENTGTANLTGLTITFDGPDAALFSIASSPAASVAPGGFTTFTVRFAPTSIGTKSAALRMTNNDEDENPFDITLHGISLSFTQDTDGDGLNDAAELQLAALGFDWQVSQTGLVNVLFSNANGAGLFTESQIQALHIDTPLLSRNPATGTFKLTLGLKKSTDLIQFAPFPFTEPGTTITGQGKLEFEFTTPDNSAFFIIEAR